MSEPKFAVTDSAGNSALSSEKQVSDRTSIIIAANTFLFTAFATLLASANITGYLRAIPLILCGTGIALNVVIGFTNIIQLNKIKDTLIQLNKNKDTLRDSSSTFATSYFTKSDNKGKDNEEGKKNAVSKKSPDIGSIIINFSNYTPIVLIVAWILCIIFFALTIK